MDCNARLSGFNRQTNERVEHIEHGVAHGVDRRVKSRTVKPSDQASNSRTSSRTNSWTKAQETNAEESNNALKAKALNVERRTSNVERRRVERRALTSRAKRRTNSRTKSRLPNKEADVECRTKKDSVEQSVERTQHSIERQRVERQKSRTSNVDWSNKPSKRSTKRRTENGGSVERWQCRTKARRNERSTTKQRLSLFVCWDKQTVE